MTDAIRNWLQDNPDYIEDLKKVVAEQKKAEECYCDEHEVCWHNTDVNVHPTRLYQMEINGVLDRTVDTNSTTKYRVDELEELEQLIAEVKSYEEDGIPEEIHTFPSEDELPDNLFEDVVGHEGAKFILKRGLTTDDIVNFLLVGPPGSGKTVFMMEIKDKLEGAEFIPATDSSSAGFNEIMFSKKPKYMLLDEIDDMSDDDQNSLSSYTETGIVKETKYDKSRAMKTNTKTIATANDTSEVLRHIRDRFEVLEFEKYGLDKYKEICSRILPSKAGVEEDEALEIADLVWDREGYGDVRRAIRIARLSRGDPEKVIGVLDDYSDQNDSVMSQF